MWLRDLWTTFKTLRVADAADIVVVACLLYLVLLWFKRTKAAFVARGIIIFALVYVVAQQAGMYLTTWMFQGFFAIIVIALVVIFQEELRSFFERLAVWSLRRRDPHPLQPHEVEDIVRTVGQFSRTQTGALIVLRGRDPLERHVEGGEGLDGSLSAALLVSVFDPHSEGHDGAVIIEGDRVTHFGVHLPLSKDFGELTGLGTRHAAALGLAERTDALCIVVSEERGVISVAKDGHIFAVRDLEALEDHLSVFLKQKAPLTMQARWRDVIRRNAWEKIVAVLIALALWLVLVQGYRPASETFKVPVAVQGVPAGLRLEALRPVRVTVTLSGLKRDLILVNPLLLRVELPVETFIEGTHTITLSEDYMRIPGPLQLKTVDPPSVELTLVGREEADRSGRRFFGLVPAEPPLDAAATPEP